MDGKLIAFSASSPDSPKSRVYVCDESGENIRLVTPKAPSYFHGWSPDGRYLAFVAERGDGKYELYRAPAAGGAEERLTFSGGYDDGPEYTPDGRWIYFNSNRGGRWNIWRIPPDGAGAKDARAERVTSDAPEDWFPHISPDGKRIVFLADRRARRASRRWRHRGAGRDLWRAGHHQRQLVVARLQAVCVRPLRACRLTCPEGLVKTRPAAELARDGG
jgi:Tol biopolymer transport system component